MCESGSVRSVPEGVRGCEGGVLSMRRGCVRGCAKVGVLRVCQKLSEDVRGACC